jgi:hypothetical protein
MEFKPIGEGRPPEIAGGSGSITHLALRFRKRTFTATCPPDRRLQLGLGFGFADGTFLSGAMVRPCGLTS